MAIAPVRVGVLDSPSAPPSRAKLAGVALGVSAGYFVGAKIGFALTPAHQAVSTLWPPNAIVLGALLLAPVRWWPVLIAAVLPAHLLVELHSGVPLPMVLCWFISNMMEALIGATCIRRLSGEPRFDTTRGVAVFVSSGALLGPFVSSFLDSAFVAMNGWGVTSYWENWSNRFFSNVLSALIFVPAIVSWGSRGLEPFRLPKSMRALEVAALSFGVIGVCTVVFAQPGVVIHSVPALLYAPLPFLLWAAIRFGPAGASACLLALAVLSAWGAIHGRGPFVEEPIRVNVISLQLFLIVTYIPLMALTALIRERRRAEQEARHAAQQLQVALSAALMGAWEWDLMRDCGIFTAESRVIFGLPDHVDELTFRRFLSDVVVPDDRLVVQLAFTNAIENSSAYDAEFRIRRPDGDVRWVHTKGTVVRDDQGQPIRMIGVTNDITDRKHAEAALLEETALRESEARLSAMADAMPQVVFIARPDGAIEYFNRRWHELTNLSTEAPVDAWIRIIHPEDRAACISAWRNNIAAGCAHEYEVRLWSAHRNEHRWYLVRALPVRDERGTIQHYYGTATDIHDRRIMEQALRDSEGKLRALSGALELRIAERTAQLTLTNESLRAEIDVRIRAEQALRASEERFAKAFRASLDAIAIVHHPTTRIIEINDRWEALFGYRRGEIIGRTIHDLHVYADDHDAERFEHTIAMQGFIREFELDMRGNHGDNIRAVLSAESVRVAQQACIIIMIRDITARRCAEQEVATQRRALAHLGRIAVLGELSGTLAHELNQPLTAILANARAAQRMLARDGVHDPELDDILSDIVADDLRAGAVIHRVRALIRKGDPDPQLVVANDVVHEVLDLAHGDLIHRAVTVSMRLTPHLPAVPADRVQMQQVMLNLIVNACDAMTDNRPAERILTIATTHDSRAVHISVADRGTGIAGSVEAVFEPFVTSKNHGLGLGLAICRSIIGAHGGRIWAVNNGDRGATFHIWLPRALGEQMEITAAV